MSPDEDNESSVESGRNNYTNTNNANNSTNIADSYDGITREHSNNVGISNNVSNQESSSTASNTAKEIKNFNKGKSKADDNEDTEDSINKEEISYYEKTEYVRNGKCKSTDIDYWNSKQENYEKDRAIYIEERKNYLETYLKVRNNLLNNRESYIDDRGESSNSFNNRYEQETSTIPSPFPPTNPKIMIDRIIRGINRRRIDSGYASGVFDNVITPEHNFSPSVREVNSLELEARLNEISVEVLTDNSSSEFEYSDSNSDTSSILSENNSDTSDENSLTSDFPDISDVMLDMFDEEPNKNKSSLIDDYADVSMEPMDIIDE